MRKKINYLIITTVLFLGLITNIYAEHTTNTRNNADGSKTVTECDSKQTNKTKTEKCKETFYDKNNKKTGHNIITYEREASTEDPIKTSTIKYDENNKITLKGTTTYEKVNNQYDYTSTSTFYDKNGKISSRQVYKHELNKKGQITRIYYNANKKVERKIISEYKDKYISKETDYNYVEKRIDIIEYTNGKVTSKKTWKINEDGKMANGWIDNYYYVNGKQKYLNINGAVRDTNSKPVTAWIDDIMYSSGKKALYKDNDGLVKSFDTNGNKTGKTITRWVGINYYKDGKLYVALYDTNTKKYVNTGKAYYIDNKGNATNETFSGWLSTKYFVNGVYTAHIVNNIVYQVSNGKTTTNVYNFNGKVGNKTYKNGYLQK